MFKTVTKPIFVKQFYCFHATLKSDEFKKRLFDHNYSFKKFFKHTRFKIVILVKQ